MSDAFVHHFPGETLSLAFNPEHPDDLGLARQAVALLRACSDLVRPLSVDLRLRYREPDTWLFRPEEGDADPPQAYRQLVVDPLPDAVVAEPFYARTLSERVSVLSPEAIERWMAAALAEENPRRDAACITWAALWVRASMARLCEPPRLPSALELRVDTLVKDVPLLEQEGRPWVAGPLGPIPDQPPVGVEILQSFGGLTATLSVHWSAWTRPASPGLSALREVIHRLRTDGWQLEQTPFAASVV